MNEVLPARVAIPETVIFQELSDEVVLLNMASEKYYGLDDVGARMWQLLMEHGDTAAVLTQLCSYYAADEATLRQDLAALLTKLEAEGLVQVN